VPNSDFGDLFLDMMADTVTIIPGLIDYEGAFVASGSTVNAPCHIEGHATLVRDVDGREVVSNVQVYIPGNRDLTTHLHRYTLPSRYVPNTELQAVSIEKATDEVGPVYEALMFP
jgi:hypothetical protein